ncbi:PREDICTED: shikimate O-hydroxycinnamoyltransferase-like [Tarenaya hassleriana]|uniref:shikimate O-hydroxycinnamoyltransferase-like n=1 Tax=Tarenaya hassleriana TaxID=28532 RepID=UPI00053C5FF8|nr:PREDICTED: shikimate O-hydroxycinnamoyltransferase-like [Tarenaya hassleriana]XP_010547372.1 PREDICTED: shikimate O-hydroxycinnamoyltransferase-like [Tarenaya hassleriana]
MKIDVKEAALVCPARDTPGGSLWLSDYDLFQPNVHNHTLHFFKPSTIGDGEITRILKQSLSQVLVPFYPLAGRLGKDENGRIQVECNAKGVMFIVAEADCSLDEMLGGKLRPNSKSKLLIPTVDYSNDISSYPISFSTVTYFKCGGMCLAVSNHHLVADGPSAVHFINSWASMARGRPIEAPVHDRQSIRGLALTSPKFDHLEFDTSALVSHQKTPPNHIDSSASYLKISPDQISTLRNKANAYSDSRKHSVFESLTAHVWRCACKARGLADDQRTVLLFAANARPRLRPPLPPLSFGNVVQVLACAAFSGEILGETLSFTAARIRKTVDGVDDEYIRSGLAFLRDNRHVSLGHSGRPVTKNPNLEMVSWTQMPLYGMDFGWGNPFYVAPATIRSEGKGYILSGPPEEGGLSLYICLEAPHLELFERLFYDI